jgi:hypothetical protein
MRMSVLLSFLWPRSHGGHHVELTPAGANVSDPQQKMLRKIVLHQFSAPGCAAMFRAMLRLIDRQCFLVGLYNVPFERQSGARAEEIEGEQAS